MTEKHSFNFNSLLVKVRDSLKWADGGIVRNTIEAKRKDLLGDAPAPDGAKKKKKEPKPASSKVEETKAGVVAEEESKIDIKNLIGRDVDIGNSAEILKEHLAFTGGKILTRFPPEPNGYLHIGHAKAIRFNFNVAAEYSGETYLRFDDTNPCKENNEFIDHITDIVSWLGYKPWKVTASSDYF